MTDQMVLATQQWLNRTYGANPAFDKVPESGQTGWTTVYGLLHALQIELGITQTADAFGPGTQSRFAARWPEGIAQQENGATAESNVYAIIQGALWCKGYGTGAGTITRHFYGGTGAAIRDLKTDMGIGGDSTVTMEIMMALLSMQQFKLVAGGKGPIRQAQQRINQEYRDYTGIIPADGLYGREMNTALIQVLQALEGFTPDEATGNFGNGTRSRLKTITPGNASQHADWVWLATVALVCNGQLSTFYGEWNSTVSEAVMAFQNEYALPVSQSVDAYTWMSLLTSCGNPNRPATACDTRFEITDEFAEQLKADGYEIVGRYLTEPGQADLEPADYFKAIRPGELDRIVKHGLRYFPIFQEYSTKLEHFTPETGARHAQEAVKAAQRLGVPPTVIYFAVDMDVYEYQVEDVIAPYFKAVRDNLGAGYGVGIYASRNTCSIVAEHGYAISSFVSDMSTGFSGNLGYPIPDNWNYDQFTEISGYHDKWDLDRVAYAGRLAPCSTVMAFKPGASEPRETTLYRWLRAVEDECEAGMDGTMNPLSPYKESIGQFILEWLRKPEYWSDGSGDVMWQAYTPEPNSPSELANARSFCAMICKRHASDDDFKASVGYPDIAHLAATALGYYVWGVETQWSKYGLGDLGGWPLDLLQIWGVYDKGDKSTSLKAWLPGHLGSRTDGGGFGYADVLADGDAWLVAKYMKERPSGHSLSEAFAGLLGQAESYRISRFYWERFGFSSSNVYTAFKELVNGIDLGILKDSAVSRWALLEASQAKRLPNEDESNTLACAYADFLKNPAKS